MKTLSTCRRLLMVSQLDSIQAGSWSIRSTTCTGIKIVTLKFWYGCGSAPAEETAMSAITTAANQTLRIIALSSFLRIRDQLFGTGRNLYLPAATPFGTTRFLIRWPWVESQHIPKQAGWDSDFSPFSGWIMPEQPGLRLACRGIVGRVRRRANGEPRLAHTVDFCSLGFPSADGPATGMICLSLREIADAMLPESAPARACGFRGAQQHLSDSGGSARDLLDEWSEWNRVRCPCGFRQAGSGTRICSAQRFSIGGIVLTDASGI